MFNSRKIYVNYFFVNKIPRENCPIIHDFFLDNYFANPKFRTREKKKCQVETKIHFQ